MSNVTPQVQCVALNTAGRDVAVGDIHGCFSALQAALEKIDFSPENDRLFSVGDLVDRGPESHQVLDWLDQPWFYAICGNHDLMTWRRAAGDPLQNVDHRKHGGAWLDDCNASFQARLAQRLRALPLALEVETMLGKVGLVHADFPYDDWQYIHSQPFSAEDEAVCLWSVHRYQSQYAQPVRNIRAVVQGHLTLAKMVQLGNVYFIDTGGWRQGGQFTLLDLQTLQVAR